MVPGQSFFGSSLLTAHNECGFRIAPGVPAVMRQASRMRRDSVPDTAGNAHERKARDKRAESRIEPGLRVVVRVRAAVGACGVIGTGDERRYTALLSPRFVLLPMLELQGRG